MNLFKRLIVFSVVLISLSVSANPLSLASVFSDHAVLQRDIAAPIWGMAQAQTTVHVVIKNGEAIVFRAQTVADENGDWQVKTKPFPAGGPYSILVSTEKNEAIILDDVLFGDVWICSGQSNMEMTYRWGLTRGKEDVENNTYSDIRLLNVPNRTSITPVKSFNANWKICEPDAAKNFSSVGYFFGAALKAKLPDVPIGLVDVTWSGTIIETWLSLDRLATVVDVQESVRKHKQKISDWLEDEGASYEQKMAEWWAEIDPFSLAEVKPQALSFDDREWKTVVLPKMFEEHIHSTFDGLVWYRTVVELTAEEAAQSATLSLGAIDDEDITYVNGVKVGGLQQWNTFRRYEIPEDTLRAGENLIAIRVMDTGKAGGFSGQPTDMKIVWGENKKSLAQEWRYMASEVVLSNKPQNLSRPAANSYSACYHGMFMPLFPMAAKGAIWYQGCSNIGQDEVYKKIFPAMVEDWRSHFTATDFPVYLVQLAAFLQTHAEPVESKWARMRWAMTELGETVPNSGTAIAIDVGDHHDIHPKDKKTVGERLARLALNRTYGRTDIVEAGPIPLTAEQSSEGIVVRFKNAVGLKTSDAAKVSGFQIVDTEGVASWASAKIVSDTIVVTAPEGMTAVTVRFAWDNYPVCNLVNGANLPSGPFELAID